MSEIINWWNAETIKTSPLLWKPNQNPTLTQQFDTHAWFASNTQSFPCHSIFPIPIKDFEEKTIVRSKKIKLNPTREQKILLAKWWEHYRFTYNRTIESIINDVHDEHDSIARIIPDFIVDEDQESLKVELGCELEPNSNIKLQIKVDHSDPKVSTKITVLKGAKTAGKIKLSIKVKKDPSIRPVSVAFGFEYPAAREWKDYRNELVTATGVMSQCWYKDDMTLLETNKFIRTGAVQQAVSAYKSVCSNAKNNGTKGSLRSIFHKKKDASWTMNLERSCISKTETRVKHTPQGQTIDAVKLCPSVMLEPIKCRERFEELGCDPKIHKDKWNDYWLIVPRKIITSVRTTNEPKLGVSIDKGEKTFVTGYTNDGHILNMAADTRNQFLESLNKIDKLQSLIDKKVVTGRTLKYIKASLEKLWKRVVNMKNDMHWKIINVLTKDYDSIIIGKFKVKDILKSVSINKNVKRVLQQQGHYQFKKRLQEKCEERGVQFKEWSEWGTTVGCPCCGHRTVVNGRTFECNSCHYTADRDAKAACAIMLKYLTGTW
jgi:putative transposase